MVAHPLLFWLQLCGVHLRQGLDGSIEGVEPRDEFPGAFPMDEATPQALLSRGREQPAVEIPELALAAIVRPRQPWQVITMEESRGIAERDLPNGLCPILTSAICWSQSAAWRKSV